MWRFLIASTACQEYSCSVFLLPSPGSWSNNNRAAYNLASAECCFFRLKPLCRQARTKISNGDEGSPSSRRRKKENVYTLWAIMQSPLRIPNWWPKCFTKRSIQVTFYQLTHPDRELWLISDGYYVRLISDGYYVRLVSWATDNAMNFEFSQHWRSAQYSDDFVDLPQYKIFQQTREALFVLSFQPPDVSLFPAIFCLCFAEDFNSIFFSWINHALEAYAGFSKSCTRDARLKSLLLHGSRYCV